MKGRVSVILPVHNEEAAIRGSMASVADSVRACCRDFEIIISEDGSTDRTVEIAREMVSKRVKLLHARERMGKGAAIRKAVGHCTGDIVIFMDADLASNPAQVADLVRIMEGGADIVIGSRYMKESKASRTPVRFAASKCFNWLVRNILGSKLSDHQCGFKAFRKDTVLPIIDEIEDQKWFWDTELLVRAQKGGLKVIETPIEWKEADTSRFRLLEDALNMGISLARFRLRNP